MRESLSNEQLPQNSYGFSLIEVLVALTLMLVISASIAAIVAPVHSALSAAPEASDVQQRLRVAADTLYTDLSMAGAGLRDESGSTDGVAAVFPYRRGAIRNSPAGSFTTDTITVLYAPRGAGETAISAPVGAASAALRVMDNAACPRDVDGARKPVCGFSDGRSVLIVDETGKFDVFTVESIEGDSAQLSVNRESPSASTVYPAGSRVVEIIERTYALHADPAGNVFQLVSYDGSDRADVPVVDNVVALNFEYYGDPQPPWLIARADDSTESWTSYGPRPPPVGVVSTGYPPGENCVFARDSEGHAVSRLPAHGEGMNPQALVKMTEAELSDGPWCPDFVEPDRFDADLLRIRAIAFTLRVQSAIEALRGPAGLLFLHGGTGTDARRWVPDREVRLLVTPRNLNVSR